METLERIRSDSTGKEIRSVLKAISHYVFFVKAQKQKLSSKVNPICQKNYY